MVAARLVWWRGVGEPCPPAILPPGGSVEGILVLHRPRPAAGTVGIVVVLGAGGWGLRPALGAVAAAPGAQGALQAVVGCGDGDGGGHGRPLGGWWGRRGGGRCAAEVVRGRQVGSAARRLWHEGRWGAGICKGNRSLTPQRLPMPTVSIRGSCLEAGCFLCPPYPSPCAHRPSWPTFCVPQ